MRWRVPALRLGAYLLSNYSRYTFVAVPKRINGDTRCEVQVFPILYIV
jgi:hypothetical protein